jgi:hypothetical protein
MFRSAARSILLVATFIAPLASGCTATVYEDDVVYVPRRRVVVFNDAPTLVYVGDGIYVVRDYDTAVYYVGGSYYYYDDGVWFSSSCWNTPWSTTSVSFVPGHLHHQRHHAYVHYAGGHDAYVVRAPRTPQDHLPANPQNHTPGSHEAHASIEGKATSSSNRVDADHAKVAMNTSPETQAQRGAPTQPSSSRNSSSGTASSRGEFNSSNGQSQRTESRSRNSESTTSSNSRSGSKETRPASFESPSSSGTRVQTQKAVQPQKKASVRKPSPSRTKKPKSSRGR